MKTDARVPLLPTDVTARNVVATSQPLAARAGVAMLERGGNAVDAAVAAAACLTVVEPTSNGIGGDLFAIVHNGQTLHGLNASGRSPAAWTRDCFPASGDMPLLGADAVTVPGAVAGWRDLHARFGRLPFADLFAPAIRHARDGFAVGPVTAAAWTRSAEVLEASPGFAEAFCPVPAAGQVWRSEAHARTLEAIAADGGASFYAGELASRVAAFVREHGGVLSEDDLASHAGEWVEPVAVGVLGRTLHEMPPNGQGLAASVAAALYERVAPPADDPSDPAAVHAQVEAMKLAFADVYAHVGDPAFMRHDARAFLDAAYLDARAALFDPARAGAPPAGLPRRGGTVYLCTADAAGMSVSLIQSNYYGFGSGLVVPGTGIALHNRGCGFVLTPGHPNEVGPRKRPFHTIIPGFVTHGGRAEMALGVMGGPVQPQGHLQVLLRVLRHGHGLQQALDAPRWRVDVDGQGRWTVLLEGDGPTPWPAGLADALRGKGHHVESAGWQQFGGGQALRRVGPGVWAAASDRRKEGVVAAC